MWWRPYPFEPLVEGGCSKGFRRSVAIMSKRIDYVSGKAEIDMAIQATTEAQLGMVKWKGCAWALGDIKSAFNYTRNGTALARIRQKYT